MIRTVDFTVDLDQPAKVVQSSHVLVYSTDLRDRFRVLVRQGGAPVSLADQTISGAVMRPDGETVVSGFTVEKEADGTGYAAIILPSECYAYPGVAYVVIRAADTLGHPLTLLAVQCRVARVTSDVIVDPGDEVPSVAELLAQIQACEDATADARAVVSGAVRHDQYQTLTDESKVRARSNIGLNFTENYLTWGENAERRLARHNIGVHKVAEVFDPTATYTKGRYVIFDGDLYRLDADSYGPAADIWGGGWTFINPTQEPISLTQRAYTDAQKKQARENIEAAPLGIMPETYGAKGDGTTDDTDALLNCLTAAYQQKRPVYFREGRTYTTSRELQIYNRIALYGNGATIKFTGASGNMLFYSDTDVDQFPDATGRAVIRDLAFDGNGAATCCIAIGMAKGLVVENLDVYGFTGVGIASAAGFENFFRDIRIAGDGSVGQRGMICGASDSRYTEIVTKNCETGIRNEGGANSFEHVHSWNTVAAIIPTSVMIETISALRAYNLYADTCAVGVKVLNDVSVLVDGFMVLHGESLVSGHTPCVFQPVSAAAIDRIKCSGAEWINSTASGVSYNLFSVDPGAYGQDYDWAQANAASLQAMGHFPAAGPLDTKANIDGYYETLTAGTAEQLISTVVNTDREPYSFRATGGTADVGNRKSMRVVGGTVAWNQQILNGNFASTSSWSANLGSTIQVSENVLTLTVSDNAASNDSASLTCSPDPKFTANHVYLFTITVNPSRTTKFRCSYSSVADGTILTECTPGGWTTVASIVKYTTAATRAYFYYNAARQLQGNDTILFKNAMVFDLTQMFGSAVADAVYAMEQASAGAGVAWFKALFPKAYYPYNAGELMHVNPTAHVTTGFNAWDEEWESGTIDGTTGANVADATKIRAKNLIPVLPGAAYAHTGYTLGFYEYDTDGAFIQYTSSVTTDTVLTTTSRTRYLRFSRTATTYNHDICINLSHSGYRDGEYEEYATHSYALDAGALRGIPKWDGGLYFDGDTYESDGTVTRRYGIVTFDGSSDESWFLYKPSNYDSLCFTIITSNKAIGVKKSISDYGINVDSCYGEPGSGVYKIYCDHSSLNRFYFRQPNADVTTIAQWKTYLASNPVTVVYELATPTTETASPYADPIIIDDFGTETWVDERTVAIPVGHETAYQVNLRDKLQHLPDRAAQDGTYLITQTGQDMALTLYAAPTPDATLTVSGAPADAAAVGELKTVIDTHVFGTSPNLYDPSTDVEGYGLSTDGTLTANSSRRTTDFIYIGQNNAIAVKCETSYGSPDGGMFVCQYDENKTFISGSRSEMTDANGWKTYTFTRAVYIRMSMHIDTPAFMLNYGTTLLKYVPYGDIWADDITKFVDGRINGGSQFRWSSMHIPNVGECPDYEGLDGTGEFSTSTSLSDLYTAWDDLASAYPAYITKTDLGLDQSGTYHLYKFSFVPETINVNNGNISLVSPPKVLIGGSVHGMGDDAGDQPEMAFALLYFFRNVCANWKTDEALAYLRWHVRFEVIPVQNPWGFQNGSRRNSRQVDINRNFPFGWTLGTAGANDYGGASALSEKESQIIKAFVDSNADAQFHLDVHTTGGSPEQAKMIYFAMIDGSEMCYVANDLVLQLSEKWDAENIGGLTAMNFHGYISDPADTGNGQINQYVTKTVGVPSCIIEGFPTFTGNTTGLHSKIIMGMCLDELINVILRGLNFFKR